MSTGRRDSEYPGISPTSGTIHVAKSSDGGAFFYSCLLSIAVGKLYGMLHAGLHTNQYG